MSEATVRYFAFGANMARRVLVKRRGIHPLASVPARLDGYALQFSLRGLPLFEPAFATIVASPGESTWGVLHTLTTPDLARLDRIESAYDRVDVLLQTPEGPTQATAYTARRPVPEKMPSRRYLRLLCEGAREHGLPSAWIDALAARKGAHVALVSPAIESIVEVGERALHSLRGRPRCE